MLLCLLRRTHSLFPSLLSVCALQSSWTDPNIPAASATATAPASVASTTTTTAPVAPTPVVAPEWQRTVHAESGREYWYNRSTGKSSWTDPALQGTH